MHHRSMPRSLILALTVPVAAANAQTATEWRRPSGPHADQVHALLVGHDSALDLAEARTIAAAGVAVVPTIAPYLQHPEPSTRRFAVALLEEIDDLPSATVVEMLEAEQHDVRAASLRLAVQRLEQKDVVDALASSLERAPAGDIYVSSLAQLLRGRPRSAARPVEKLQNFCRKRLTRILESSGDFDRDAGRAVDLVRILGGIAAPGDDEALACLRRVDAWAAQSPRDPRSAWMRNELQEAVLLAQVSLDDRDALARYISERTEGDAASRREQLETLAHLDSEMELLHFTSSLLARESPRQVAAPQPAADWMRPTGPQADQVHALLVGQGAVLDRDEARKITAAGVDAVPVIEPYLRHPEPNTRLHAVSLLSRIEDLPSSTVTAMLKAEDWRVRTAGLPIAVRSLEQKSIVRALVASLDQAPQGGGFASSLGKLLQDRPRSATRPIDELKSFCRDRLTRILNSSDDFSTNARYAVDLVQFLGGAAESGDEETLNLLRRAQAWAQSAAQSGHAKTTQELLLDAVLLARVRLADNEALTRYITECEGDDLPLQRKRLETLPRLDPDRRLLALALRLLADETPIRNAAPSHAPHSAYQRACDMAMSALGRWYPEFPVPTRAYRIHEPDQLAIAKEWVQHRLQQ